MLARVAVCLLVLSACSGDSTPDVRRSTSSTSGRQAQDAPDDRDAMTLDCRGPIDAMTAPPSGYEVIGDAVALVTSSTADGALQAFATGDTEPSQRLFAKNGLLVRTNMQSELIVPAAWHDRLSFRWGNTGLNEPTEHLLVGPCGGPADWIVFPGGYLVADPACVELIVRTADGDHRVTVGVGAPCDGQRPPPD